MTEKTLEEVKKELAHIAAMPGNTVTERTTPISKAKLPLSAEEYYAITKRFSYWGVQMGGDDSVYYNSHMCQYMHTQMVMPDGPVAELERAMFKHGNMGQGIYVDPARDFCGCYFGLATNDESVSGVDHSPGYLRTAAKLLAGK